MIYLDYAATTPMCEESLNVYREVAADYYGNSSSLHDTGSEAKKLIDTARSALTGMFGGEARGLFFTGSGSEANQLPLLSVAHYARKHGRGDHLITTAAEHSCVRNTMALLQKEGFEVDYAPLDQQGRVRIDTLKSLIRDETVLVSIQHANSEIGTIQNLREIGLLLKERDILFHSDCVQTFGKIPLDIHELHLDSLSISAHKIYGPKGTGAAYIDPALSWEPAIPNGTHERGFRPGTVDTPSIMAFMAAARLVMEHREEEHQRLRELRNQFIKGLRDLPYEIVLEGDLENSLPNIVGFRISGMEGQYAMLECNRHGLAISTGSACSVGTEKPAASMTALGRDEQEAREFVRISLGKQTTAQEIDDSIEILESVLTDHFNMVKL